ncbi:biotin--[acetyl-CoA-carboxylase] ligase [Mangrovimonas sp. DI 80]|uniref:biotin--[acetyl-CoA-carboxylase] ligase n=1 Tax=Mangrovimonas sp. DI 80 TaxID=1779330 RepID=UPI0009780728|nr:biotin--[acetyl-CoA-carboxylase] ligase [Mangrovimonas sp. DI 80]OMP30304.1 biotin--[acetyl-CoA-carboxylase] ligase [Mangrovimonas sp. DI 80]
MHIIKLSAIDSTNSYLRQLSAAQVLEDYTVVMTDRQTEGRGQMGTQWDAQEGKNLTVSVLKDISFLKIEDQFFISMAVALAISDVLKYFGLKRVKVKWPNDILSENKKIVGILIENVIKQNQIQHTIIGVGLNVNQTEYPDLPQASSMRLISGNVFDLDEVLNKIINKMEHYFTMLENGETKELKRLYEKRLFRINKPSTFKDVEGHLFAGFIKGVTDYGSLEVLLEDEVLKTFDLKEITLLY